jgi:hypothetical protein
MLYRHFRQSLAVALVGCVFVLSSGEAPAQNAPGDAKQAQAFQKTQKLLDREWVPLGGAPPTDSYPLDEILKHLEERQIPFFGRKMVTFRIDNAAFGNTSIAKMLVLMPSSPAPGSLRYILEELLGQLKVKADYCVHDSEVIITTPPKALYEVRYDVSDLIAKPLIWAKNGEPFRKAAADAQFLKAVFPEIDARARIAVDGESVHLLNAASLVVHSNATRHAAIAEVLGAFRRKGDVAVITKAQLYEVEDDFFKKLKNAKRIPPEEAEQLFLGGKATQGDTLFNLLPKQKLLLAGEAIKSDNSQTTALLSWQHMVTALAKPERVRVGEQAPQIAVEGVSFFAEFSVSPDRRWVKVKLTEKDAEIEETLKVKVLVRPGTAFDAEIVFPKETSNTHVLAIPDGGATLVPVHYRPASVRAKDRWWVFCVSTRIYIEEEQRQERIQMLRTILPRWLADAVTKDD